MCDLETLETAETIQHPACLSRVNASKEDGWCCVVVTLKEHRGHTLFNCSIVVGLLIVVNVPLSLNLYYPIIWIRKNTRTSWSSTDIPRKGDRAERANPSWWCVLHFQWLECAFRLFCTVISSLYPAWIQWWNRICTNTESQLPILQTTTN